MIIQCLISFVLLLGVATSAVAETQSSMDLGKAKHTGVATCASSVCHGRVAISNTSYAALNEYRVWAGEDLHAKAYAILENDHSKRIAKNMGIGDPTSEGICLDCHSDNVPAEQRGEKFRLSDGVGCEACHGPAEHWIASHDSKDASHDKNVAKGMFPAGEPLFQARLCLSCHMGNDKKMATHEIMAAGHPRLRFELDTYLASMPRHHVIDKDYEQRKGTRATADRWATGIMIASSLIVENVQSHRFSTDNIVPEIALFDCHSCHRDMDTDVRRTSSQRRLPAGSLRIGDSALRILPRIIELRDKSLAKKLDRGIDSLHGSAVKSVSQAKRSAGELLALIKQAEKVLVGKQLSDQETIALRKALLKKAGAGIFRDYSDAEQLFMSVEVLTVALDRPDYPLEALDGLFKQLEKEQRYDPDRFAREARRIGGR